MKLRKANEFLGRIVNSLVESETANTILKQMGGANRIKTMTGASLFVATEGGNGVSFRFPSPHGGPNYVKIVLNDMDEYDVEFGRLKGTGYKVVKKHNDVQADQLIDLFEKETGLYLRL